MNAANPARLRGGKNKIIFASSPEFVGEIRFWEFAKLVI